MRLVAILTFAAFIVIAALAHSGFAAQRKPQTQAEVDCWNRATNDYYDQVRECEKALSDNPQQLDQCKADAREDLDRTHSQCVKARIGNTTDAGTNTRDHRAEAIGPGMSDNIDRAGSDFQSFQMSVRSPAQCQAACTRARNCKAWTYVRAGVQATNAICYLKDRIPVATKDNCCISGVMAQGVVRDHRVIPEVRDHRDDQNVRDHRN